MFHFFAKSTIPCALSIFCPKCPFSAQKHILHFHMLFPFAVVHILHILSIPFSAQEPQDRQSITSASGATS
ncbi:unnamed protein product [Meloidogyne enterolobii]|uniref:Uncharacterized protein n=1 Tax=Meloidogyne enterolobii TaxID=390850 RepID=A0ACB0Y4C2_MELEN